MIEDGFNYKNFEIADDRRTVQFKYEVIHNSKSYNFTEKLIFPVDLTDSTRLLSAMRALHIALGVSYYKIFVSPAIRHPYEMSEAEAEFWNNVWLNGLGEFLYVNKLNSNRLAKFRSQPGKLLKDSFYPEIPTNKTILGIGGGKDSIVAGELLKELGSDLRGFVMATGEQRGQAASVAETMGIDLLIVERHLDKYLLEVQELDGAYKGHIPISLIFGLVGTVLAIANGYSNVVVANESSSSIPRVTWENNPVNHQWSKSFEFEKILQNFIKSEIDMGITYFSAIRPLTSVAVAKIFANYSQYFEVFTSDNYIFRIDPAKRPNSRWSLESPKSLSSFILLSPWLDEAALTKIFGRNFYNENTLEGLFAELIGHSGHPPLDCVGTVEELQLSLNLCTRQNKFIGSFLIDKAKEWQIVSDENDWQSKLDEFLKLQPEDAYPQLLSAPLKELLNEKLS